MREIVSNHRSLQAFRHVVVSAPMMEPEAGVIYRIRPKNSKKNARGLRQNGHTQRSNAARTAKDLWPNAKLDVDFTIYTHDGQFFGFLPIGGTPQPDMAQSAASPEAVAYTPSQRRDAFKELSDLICPDTGRYIGDWTDATVAETLDLPEGLISEVRVQFFGEPEPELSAEERALLTEALAEVEAIKAAHLKMAATSDGVALRIRNILAGLK